MRGSRKAVLKEPAAAIERWSQGEDIPALKPGDWLEVAQSSPRRFVWVVDPERVLPIDKTDDAQHLWATLKPALAEESLDISLGWLALPGLGLDEEAVALLEERLSKEASECSWLLLAEALETLAARGAPWRAARLLEAHLDGAGLDTDEIAQIASTACRLMDGPLLAAMARSPIWQDDDVALARFANAASTASLIDNFGGTVLPRRLRLSREAGDRLQGAVWRILASRVEQPALTAVQSLLVAIAPEPATEQLATAMTGILQQAHGESARPAMVRIFLSGMHHTPAGEAIERWLMQFPLASLEEALDPFPEGWSRFDERALRRLCFRMLPQLNIEQRTRLVSLADLAGGPRAAVVHEELELLP